MFEFWLITKADKGSVGDCGAIFFFFLEMCGVISKDTSLYIFSKILLFVRKQLQLHPLIFF